MNNNNLLKRRIDIHREELAWYTEQFLARGGQIMELPVCASKVMPLVSSRGIDLRSSVDNAVRKREERDLRILDLRRAGMNIAEIARQIGVDRSVVTRSLTARGLS